MIKLVKLPISEKIAQSPVVVPCSCCCSRVSRAGFEGGINNLDSCMLLLLESEFNVGAETVSVVAVRLELSLLE